MRWNRRNKMKREITLKTIIAHKKDLPSTNIDGEIALMNIETGKYFTMNLVGSDIWNKTINPISVENLVSSMKNEYDIDIDTCRQQVLIFLEKLLCEGIIEILSDGDE